MTRQPPPIEPLPRVAHAGGGIDGATYTNSREAVLASLDKGFAWIEIDFVWTSDGRLVCIHDWKRSFERLFGRPTESPLSLAEFREEAAKLPLTLLSLDDLKALMLERPALTVVTDVKSNNIAALERMAKVLPEAARRVVPQIYRPNEYKAARKAGYERIVWTLYRYRHQRDIHRVLEEAQAMDLAAVCMPAARAREGHALALRERGIPTYAHTANRPEEAEELKTRWGVTEVYTDFLPPADG